MLIFYAKTCGLTSHWRRSLGFRQVLLSAGGLEEVTSFAKLVIAGLSCSKKAYMTFVCAQEHKAMVVT